MENVVPLREAAPSLVEDLSSRTKHSFRFPFVIDGAEIGGGRLQWVIKKLLISGGLSVVYGPPKSGKSFVAGEAAYRVANGQPFFGMPTRQGLVVYLCGEGATGFRQRMTAWRKFNDMPPTRNFVMMPAKLDITGDSNSVGDLIDDLRALSLAMGQPIVMIVIDTLSKYFGANDENQAPDMNRFCNNIDGIQTQLERHLQLRPHALVVHHTGKNIAAGMRGSNALLGAADCTIEVTLKDDGVRQARVADMKDESPPPPFHFKLPTVVIGIDDDGDPVRSCVVEPTTIVIPEAESTGPKAVPEKRKPGRPRKVQS